MGNESFESRIVYTDETAQYYYENEAEIPQKKEIANEVERTKYFTCYFVGRVRRFKN